MSENKYLYPLPIKFLRKRYKGVFEAIKNNLSVNVTGLPLSSRSGFLKFILTNPEILLKFIDASDYHFIIQDQTTLNDMATFRLLVAKILQLPIISKQQSQKLLLLLQQDPLVTQTQLAKLIIQLPSPIKIIICIFDAEKFFTDKPESTELIITLTNLSKHNPQRPGCLLLTTTSINPILPNPMLQSIIQEKQIIFPLLDSVELEYTKKRLSHLRSQSIKQSTHSLASRLSFGHYLLYKTITTLPKKELQLIKKNKTHPSIDYIIQTIWQSLPITIKKNWSWHKLRKFKPLAPSPLLPPPQHHLPPELILTANEQLVFNLLKQKNIVSKEEIAQTIWEDNWTEKYSIWAIDKLMSKLRQKLLASPYKIMTFRNKGYNLSTIKN